MSNSNFSASEIPSGEVILPSPASVAPLSSQLPPGDVQTGAKVIENASNAPATVKDETGTVIFDNVPLGGEPGITTAAVPKTRGDVHISEAVDAGKESTLATQTSEDFKAAIADAVGVSRQMAETFTTYYAPLIARQALLQQSSDPEVAKRAEGHRRHLWGQMLMKAAEYGIPLQQRQEQRFLAAINGVLDKMLKLI